jgi:hypothetical protein
MTSSGDRRRRNRVPVHWPVRLFRQAGQSVQSTTENLSSGGLYCITSEPFKAGERLQCVIVLPGGTFGAPEPFLQLQCQITVKRVEHVARGFGLGCQIEDYTLRPSIQV